MPRDSGSGETQTHFPNARENRSELVIMGTRSLEQIPRLVIYTKTKINTSHIDTY